MSAALALDERDVTVEDQDEEDIFYRVVLTHADEGLKPFLNSAHGLATLNGHAAGFGATLFLARPAALLTSTPPSPPPPPRRPRR